jgi:hypothetical protein
MCRGRFGPPRPAWVRRLRGGVKGPRAGLPCEVQSLGTNVPPPSLYRQQLVERLCPAALDALGPPAP